MIENQPSFVFDSGNQYLADKNGNPELYTARHKAEQKLIELMQQGHEVEVEPGNVFYRIKLLEAAIII